MQNSLNAMVKASRSVPACVPLADLHDRIRSCITWLVESRSGSCSDVHKLGGILLLFLEMLASFTASSLHTFSMWEMLDRSTDQARPSSRRRKKTTVYVHLASFNNFLHTVISWMHTAFIFSKHHGYGPLLTKLRSSSSWWSKRLPASVQPFGHSAASGTACVPMIPS
jgi:hypothetical protein